VLKRSNISTLSIQPQYYRHCVEHEASGLIFTSGQVGYEPYDASSSDMQQVLAHVRPISEDVGEQFREILRHFDLMLDHLGLGKESFASVTVFTTEVDRFYERAWPLWEEYFGGEPPAATMIGVSALAPGFKVEAQAILAR